MALDIRHHLAGVGLIPMPIEGLGHDPELDNEVPRQVLRLGLAPFLPPEPEEGGFVALHNDPGIRAADKALPRSGIGYFAP